MNTAFNLRISQPLHDTIKRCATGSISKTVNAALLKATIDDVVAAILKRYEGNDVPDDPTKNTTVLVSELTRQNVDVIALKTSIPRDAVVRLLLENHFNRVDSGQSSD